MRAQIAWLKKKLLGPGQGETLERAQLLLQLGALEQLAGQAAAQRPTETVAYERPAGPAPKRTLPAESFAHLPVQETVEIGPEAVRAGPALCEKIGEERTFEVDVTPPQLFKRVIRAAEVPAPPGSPPRAPARARAEARGRGRLRLRGADRLGVDREVLRPPAVVSSGKNARTLGRADLAPKPLRLGGCRHRAARTAHQANENRVAAKRLRAGRRNSDPLQRSRPAGRQDDAGLVVGALATRRRGRLRVAACPAGTRRPSGCSAIIIAACSSPTATKRMPPRRARTPASSGPDAGPLPAAASSSPPPSDPRPPSASCG